MSLENIGLRPTVRDRFLPVVDLNNLDRGIVGQTGHFPNMTERVSGGKRRNCMNNVNDLTK